MSTEPPIAKYKLTVEITGNSHEEIERELHFLANGGYLIRTGYHERDEHDASNGKCSSKLQHLNPDMTEERFDAELDAWFQAFKAERRGGTDERTEEPA